MDERKLKINISAIGDVNIEAVGFSGCGCTEKTKSLEELFSGGGANFERDVKAEYYEAQGQAVEVNN